MDTRDRLVVSLDFYRTPYEGDKRFITPYLTFLYKEIDNVSEGIRVLDEEGTPTPEIDTHAKQLVDYDDQREKEAFARHLKADTKYQEQQELHRTSVQANAQATAINDLLAQQIAPGDEAPALVAVPPLLPPGVDPGPFNYMRNTGAAQRVIANERAMEKMRKAATAALKKLEETIGYGLKTKHVKILSDTNLHPRQRLAKMHKELLKLTEGNLVLISSIKNDVRKLKDATNFQELSEIVGEIDKFDFQIASMSPVHKYRDAELIAIITGEKTHNTIFNQFKLDWARREREASRQTPPRSLTWDEFKEEINLSVENLPGTSSTTALSAMVLTAVEEQAREDSSETIKSLQEQIAAMQAQVLAVTYRPNHTDDTRHYERFASTLDNAIQQRRTTQQPPQRMFSRDQPFRPIQRSYAHRGTLQPNPYGYTNPKPNGYQNQQALPQQRQPNRYSQSTFSRQQDYGGGRGNYGGGRGNYGGGRNTFGGGRTSRGGFRQGTPGARAYTVMGDSEENPCEEEQYIGDEDEEDYVTYEEHEPSSSSSSRDHQNET